MNPRFASRPSALRLKFWQCSSIYFTVMVLFGVITYALVLQQTQPGQDRDFLTAFTLTGILALSLPMINLAIICYFLSRIAQRRTLMPLMFAAGLCYLIAIQPFKAAWLGPQAVDMLVFGTLTSAPALVLTILWQSKPQWVHRPARILLGLALCLLVMAIYAYILVPWRAGLSWTQWTETVLHAHLLLALYWSLPLAVVQLLPLWLGARRRAA